MMSKVEVIGLGYIGLPTAAILASNQISVIGVDINDKVVATINKGLIHIVEPDLEGLVRNVVEKNLLYATNQPQPADVFIITVPTPFDNQHKPDLTFVENAIKSIIPHLQENNLVIIESTCPVGTTEKMAELIIQNRKELREKIYMAYCPERVLPGNIIHELVHNDRVIGGINKESADKAKEFYSMFVKGNLHLTNARTAEMCKLVENSYRDTNIAFVNEISIICDKAGINVWELIKLANNHPRVKLLQPGIGVGGHCIAVDPWFIISDFPNESQLIKTARLRNNYKTQWVIEKITSEIRSLNYRPKVAFMGLSFKPDVDDTRESPAIEIFEHFSQLNICDCLPVEPNLKTYYNLHLYHYKDAIELADVIVFLVAHKEFKNIAIAPSKKILNFCGISASS